MTDLDDLEQTAREALRSTERVNAAEGAVAQYHANIEGRWAWEELGDCAAEVLDLIAEVRAARARDRR